MIFYLLNSTFVYIYASACIISQMSDTEDAVPENVSENDTLDKMQLLDMELTRKLDSLHAKEFRNAVIQPCLFLLFVLLMVLFYYYLSAGLLLLVPVCFVLSCIFPMLQIPMWISLALILVKIVG